MGTVDSGNETLFSDESPTSTPATPRESPQILTNGIAPPKIQSSGVLGQGKIVIRPIAFKPIGMTPAARFGNSGERYGSTPILPRAGSHLPFYGSTTDLRRNNYSLDRKLKSSCTSTSSSPPLGLFRKIESFDSIPQNRNNSTPSPSDSGVSELEAALRDRDSELAYLRQTMEHNEQVIFRVYQEKERVWERELRRMKQVHENRLRASAQKAHKLEQMLMMQTYQKKIDNERVQREYREEIESLRSRLEESDWALCQKTGEISLLKSQLKEAQSENTSRGHELLCLRSEFRKLRDRKDSENSLEGVSELSEYEGLEDGVQKLLEQMNAKMAEFEKERIQWKEEKEKVINYQRQLQCNYVQMFRKSKNLEAEVESLRLELALMAKDANDSD